MSIEWKSSYAIGVAEIDAEHRELFRIANSLLTAKTCTEQTTCAMGLYQYTNFHFKHEEQLMRRIDYPGYDEHYAQHEDLISRLNVIAQHIAIGTLDAFNLDKFMTHWLLTHIRLSDTKLASHIAKQAAPVSKTVLPSVEPQND